MRRWVIVVAFVALAAWFFGKQAVDAARDFVTRGRRLTRCTLEDGVVTEQISWLVQDAGKTLGRPVDTDAYSIARMLRSEYGNGPVKAKVAMAWVALNDSRALGRGITSTLNAGSRAGTKYGAQEGGRYSTAQDPYENDLAIAEAVLAGELADDTGGAVKFIHRSGILSSDAAYEGLVARWAPEGLYPVDDLDGVGSLVVFRRQGAVV